MQNVLQRPKDQGQSWLVRTTVESPLYVVVQGPNDNHNDCHECCILCFSVIKMDSVVSPAAFASSRSPCLF